MSQIEIVMQPGCKTTNTNPATLFLSRQHPKEKQSLMASSPSYSSPMVESPWQISDGDRQVTSTL